MKVDKDMLHMLEDVSINIDTKVKTYKKQYSRKYVSALNRLLKQKLIKINKKNHIEITPEGNRFLYLWENDLLYYTDK
jgi:hypothetical protein